MSTKKYKVAIAALIAFQCLCMVPVKYLQDEYLSLYEKSKAMAAQIETDAAIIHNLEQEIENLNTQIPQ